MVVLYYSIHKVLGVIKFTEEKKSRMMATRVEERNGELFFRKRVVLDRKDEKILEE